MPMSPSATVSVGPAPRARRTSRSASSSWSRREISWTAMNRAADRGDPTEHPEGDGQGLDGPIDLGGDRGDGVESQAVARRRHRGQLPLDGGDGRVPPVELEPVGDGAGRPLPGVADDLVAQGGREEDEGRVPVDVVLDQALLDLDQPDHPGVESSMGWDRRGAEARLGHLGTGVDPDRDELSDVQPEQTRRQGSHHDLVSPTGIGHPPGDDGQAVLVEEEAVDAGDRFDVAEIALAGDVAGAERGGIDRDGGFDVLHAGQSADGPLGRHRIARRRPTPAVRAAEDRHVHVRGVGAGQVGREGRLGPPGRRAAPREMPPTRPTRRTRAR